MPDTDWRGELARTIRTESALASRVRLDGRNLGTLIGPSFRIELGSLRPGTHQLEVEVTNVAANRIRDLDRRGVHWKIFHNINFVSIDYKPFDASNWPLHDSGLCGPVRLQRVERTDPASAHKSH